MAGKARAVSSLIDRHPRPALAVLVLLEYAVVAVLVFGIYHFMPPRDADVGSRTTQHIVMALVVSVFGIGGSWFRWRREWERLGLSNLDDWWTVTRCVER